MPEGIIAGNLSTRDIERYVNELKANVKQINNFEPFLKILTNLQDRIIRIRLVDGAGSEVISMICHVKEGKVVGLDTGALENADIDVLIDTRALQYILEKPSKDRFFRQYLKRRIRIKGITIDDFIG